MMTNYTETLIIMSNRICTMLNYKLSQKHTVKLICNPPKMKSRNEWHLVTCCMQTMQNIRLDQSSIWVTTTVASLCQSYCMKKDQLRIVDNAHLRYDKTKDDDRTQVL